MLDVGCAQGGFGPTLREVLGPEARIVGVEAVASQAEIAARGQGYDLVVPGYFPQALNGSDERFDLVCFNDVLEHIYAPWETVRSVHEFLLPGGRVLAAIPNVQVIDNLVALMHGAWDYTDWGILDRTHVRFFTRRTMIELFEDNGFAVESCVGVNPSQTEGRWRAHRLSRGVETTHSGLALPALRHRRSVARGLTSASAPERCGQGCFHVVRSAGAVQT